MVSKLSTLLEFTPIFFAKCYVVCTAQATLNYDFNFVSEERRENVVWIYRERVRYWMEEVASHWNRIKQWKEWQVFVIVPWRFIVLKL
jgi:hypothetical protein